MIPHLPVLLLQLVIYGLNGAIVPAETIPFDSAFFGYLEFVLKPGGAEVPASLVVDAVNAGDTATVAAVFDQAVQAGYTQQLVAILNQVGGLSSSAAEQLYYSFVCVCESRYVQPCCLMMHLKWAGNVCTIRKHTAIAVLHH